MMQKLRPTATSQRNKMERASNRYLPLWIGLSWSVGTILLFAFGPYRYHISNTSVLYLYLFATQIAIWGGYQSGVAAGSKGYKGRWKPRKIIHLAIFVTFIKIILDYMLGVRSFVSLDLALSNPSLARLLENDRAADYLGIFLAPLTASAIPLSVFYWSRISRLARFTVVLFVIEVLVQSVLTATRNGILALAIYTLMPMLAAGRGGQDKVAMFRLVKRPILTSVVLAAFVVFLMYANYITENRAGDFQMRLYDRTDATFEYENIVARYTPASVKSAVVEGIYYYTHSYANLALALDKPFVGTAFGFGHSRFLTRNLLRLFDNYNLLRRSYFFRLNLEDGVLLSKWITAYAWWASDVTFLGTIPLLFLFGRLVAQSWLDALRGDNPFSVLMIALLFYQLISLPQVTIAQDGPGLTSLYATLVVWLITRSRN